jgi:copper chaperone CopZ
MKKICLALVLSVCSVAARADTIEMKVFGMVCGFCAQGIEASLRKNPATVDVVVSLEKQLVVVQTHPGVDIPNKDLESAITSAGYDLKSVARTTRTMAEVRGDLARKTD